MLRLLCLLFALSLPLAHVSAQEEDAPGKLQTSVMRDHQDGHVFHIQAEGITLAPPQRAWQVLTDYERLPAFVPNLRVSKILSHDGHETILEQESTAGFLFIRQSVHLVVRVVESPPSVIDVTLVSGDMKRYIGRWEVEPVGTNGSEGTRIRYTGYLEPAFFVPPVVGPAVVRKDVKNMVRAVMAEIDAAPNPQGK
jgi:ribosome-associated toxin RatA of RatAB toxin-antitoxin module